MSLLETRAEWLKLTRNVGAEGEGREHVLVAATFTAEPLAPYLGMQLVDGRALPPLISIAPYNQILQLCHDGGDSFASTDAVIVLWRLEDLAREDLRAFLRGGDASPILAKVEELANAIAVLRSRVSGALLVSTPPYPHSPDHHVRSPKGAQGLGGVHRKVVELWLKRMSEIDDVSVLDLDGLQRFIGIRNSEDHRKWYLYRQPFSELFWSEMAADAARLIRGRRAAPMKCLVVDCDNTLWGGIVGEDGIAGLALGDDHPGAAFVDFQHQLLTLKAQGVMLALCSKNNEADVWEVFDRHDAMVLQREDLVAHRINWTDKGANIASLAEELNIGLDSLVFVDDSPVEIAQVQAALPMVTCIQVPEDVSAFPGLIAAYRGFDREQVTDEDRARSGMMVQERARRDLMTGMSSEEFRRSLELVVDLFKVEPEHVARVAQLTNKTNQFNLTTIRRTPAEISALVTNPSTEVLAWRVSDRFGDYGLVGVAILERKGETLEIDTLLMSCRVLGRGVEAAVLAGIREIAGGLGATRLEGAFVPTAKNQPAARLFPDHGFVEMAPGRWAIDTDANLAWPEGTARPGL
ncbi:MAG TPA: HAD-IIIC family phosphatase [Caulobacteraceae bacterium]|jgi:FkbH-like protein